MANRSVKIDIGANVTGLLNGVRSAKSAVGGFMSDLDDSAQRQREAWQTAGTALTGFGVAVGGALALATREAIGWESAWAGVTKTVDGSASTMAALEDGLRGMAREMPATHEEIAAVAEAAGALGVSTADVEGFTETMVMLGETTNLTADEAATSIAQISNVMGTMDREGAQGVERFASALVHLGNNGASTEQEILQLSTRLSSTASVIGMSEADVLGYANALASVGINAEAGGTAMSRVFMDMAESVSQGGEDLEAFAEIAGMSAEQFATAFQEDPAEAVATFISGLGDISAAGGDVFGVLDDLGMSDIRVSQALLTMAESGDFLTESLQMGEQAWQDNTAVQDEYQQRLETTAAQMDIAKNNIVDAAISLGSVFLPAIAEVSGAIADLAGWFADLPGPIQTVIGVLGGIAASATLAAGGFLLLFPAIGNTIGAFQTIAGQFPGLAQGLRNVGSRASGAVGGVRGLGRAFGGLTIGVVALGAVATGMKAVSDRVRGIDRTATSFEEMENAIMHAGDAASYYDTLLGDMAESGQINTDAFGDLATAIDQAADTSLWDDVLTFTNLDATGIEDVQAEFETFGQVLSELPIEMATQKFADLWEEAGGSEETGQQLLELMPAWKEQLTGLANELGLTADDATLLALATGEIGPEMEEAGGTTEETGRQITQFGQDATLAEGEVISLTGEIRELTEAEQEFIDTLSGGSQAFVDFQGALQSIQEEHQRVAQEAADATEDTGDSWEDFYDGFSVGLGEWLAELEEMTAAQAEWETNMLLLSTRVSDGVLEELGRLGPEGAPLVADLVDASDEELDRLEDVFGQGGAEASEAFALAMENPDTAAALSAVGQKWGEATMREVATALANQETTLQDVVRDYDLWAELNIDETPAWLDVEAFQAQVNGVTGEIMIGGRTIAGEESLAGLLGQVGESHEAITIDGENLNGRMSLDELVGLVMDAEGDVTIDGDNTRGAAVLRQLVDLIWASEGNVGVDGEDRGASSETNRLLRWIRTQDASVGINAHVNARSVSAAIGGIIAQANRASASVRVGGLLGRASGGPVWGAGTATSDSIPAMLSNGEHVLSAREVIGLGGHGAVAAMRVAAREGMSRMAAPQRYATGGQVGRMEVARSAPATVVQQASLPSYVTLVDESGGILTRARVVAHDEHRAQTKHEGAWRR